MLQCPFEIVQCSWPCNIQQREQNPAKPEPAWNTPSMPHPPSAFLELLNDQWYWSINWAEFFRSNFPSRGQMRGFHVVFRLKIKADGTLFVKGEEGCVIRRGGEVIYSCQDLQMLPLRAPLTSGDPVQLQRHLDGLPQFQIEVKEGEVLEVALYHATRTWVWGAYLLSSLHPDFALPPDPVKVLIPYLERVEASLRSPDGPPLKIYTNSFGTIRTIVGIYSLVLNGYVPSNIYLFGDSQWSDFKRKFMEQLLPFAQNVPTSNVLAHLQTIGGAALADMASNYWPTMKTAIALLYPPHEFCLIDDDILVLRRLDDALEAFKKANLVYTTNLAHEKQYIETWKSVFKNPPSPLPTVNLSAGFYWLRNTKDPGELAKQMIQVPPPSMPWLWEQGFIALAYADESCFELPSQNYYIPIVDGLPGGILAYDYVQNPCGFSCLHFAGREKPSDGNLLFLLPQILH